MRTIRSFLLLFAGVITVVLAIAAVPIARAAAVTDDNVDQALASAKTAADHQALADYFSAKAATAKANVALHEKMNTVDRPEWGAGGAKSPGQVRWHEHCQRLISTYKSQAKDYEAMAAEEAKLATKAK